MRTQHGFTLIELMITVAIIAILSAIAIPQYSEYVMRSRITEATMTLSDQRLKMERFFQDNRSFTPAGLPAACTANTVAPPPGPTAHFNFTCTVTSPTTYTGHGNRLRVDDRLRLHHQRSQRPRDHRRAHRLDPRRQLLGAEEGRVVLKNAAQRGFSLVELATAMTIIAILMMLGMPSFSEYINNARLGAVAQSFYCRIDPGAQRGDPAQRDRSSSR